MSTLLARTGSSAASERRIIGLCDTVLDVAVWLFAAWTVIYHICLVTRAGARWALVTGLAFVALAALAGLSPRGRGLLTRAGEPGPATPRGIASHTTLVVTCVGAGSAAAGLFAAGAGPWWVTWVLWLTAAGAGLAWAVLTARRTRRVTDAHDETGTAAAEPGPEESETTVDRRPARRGTVAVVLSWALGLAAFSLFLNRPDGDDTYYLGFAAWVAERGSFPLRDTLMGNLEFPALYWPPVASYNALIGMAGRYLPLSTPDVAYFVVPPLATFLAVLAFWRLLRAWRVPAVALALSLCLLFLLWGGGNHWSFGNFFLGRIWQGKVILLSVMIPLLIVYLQRFAEHPSWRRGGTAFAAGVACVGFSTNAMFLVPLIALAGVCPLALRAPRRAAAGFVAAAGYALGAGVVTLAVGGYTPDNYASMTDVIVPSWLTHHVLDHGLRAGVALFVLLVGALLVPRPSGRIVAAALAVLAGIAYAPGMPLLIHQVTGIGRALWRVLWIVPVAPLVGALGAACWAGAPRLVRHGAPRSLVRRAAPVGLALAVTIPGTPLWSPTNGTAHLTAVPRWKLPVATLPAARMILHRAEPGDHVLAPTPLAQEIAVLTSRVKTVLPRDFYANPLEDVPGFHADARRLLKDLVFGRLDEIPAREVSRALRLISVDVVCVRPDADAAARFVRHHGYTPLPEVPATRCYARGEDA